MKKSTPFEIIENYLFNLSQNQETSTTETEIYLDALVNYIFQLKNINRENYRVVIHKTNPKDFKKFQLAKMTQDKDFFEIFLSKNNFSINNKADFYKILDLSISCGHETQHILQYILSHNLMEKYDNFMFAIEDTIDDFKSKKGTPKGLIKRLQQLLEANKIMSKIEINADYRANQYIATLIHELYNSKYINNIDFFELVKFFELLLEDKILDDADLYQAQEISNKKIINSLVYDYKMPPQAMKIF